MDKVSIFDLRRGDIVLVIYKDGHLIGGVIGWFKRIDTHSEGRIVVLCSEWSYFNKNESKLTLPKYVNEESIIAIYKLSNIYNFTEGFGFDLEE